MFDRFTERAKKVLAYAKQEAQRFNHDYIGTEHILLGILKEGTGVAVNALENLGLDIDELRQGIESQIKTGPDTFEVGNLPYTPRAKKVLQLSLDEARALNHKYIGTEHLLLGLLREQDGEAAHLMRAKGISLQDVREEVLNLLPDVEAAAKSEPKNPEEKEEKALGLATFGRNLTTLAVEGKLDPVIGREKEIERVIQVLCRRTKNNPVLLGEAGVGKTAIVEGLAQKIVSGDIPDILLDKKIISLDLALLVAGTKYRGQFEERIKRVLKEVRQDPTVMLFIDELHTIVGAGGAEGAIDASNVLKPPLSRGEIQCIGATTLDEYRKYIEKDGALDRRFQSIMVDPSTKKESVEILRGLRDRYEAHHRVKITDAAIEAAVKLSDRYISGRFLPDKAIDVIDEAGARVRLRNSRKPDDIKQLRARVEEMEKNKADAVSRQNFEEAAEYRDKAEKLKEERIKREQAWRAGQNEVLGTVDEEVVEDIVAHISGVPVTRLKSGEANRLLKMEEELHKTVVSQDEAIHKIARAVRRSRAGMKNPKRPVGCFVFVGPTGVGKTLLSKALAEFMFGDQNALVQIDMSEYMEKHSVSRLTGAPPGYVGYEEGGQLSETIRRKPYSVVLLDEIEKAHPDVFNILLQIMEDGRLTDSYGRTVDFKNTVLIMTSNIGAETLMGGGMGFRPSDDSATYEAMKQNLLTEVKNLFRPEFINRVDDIIVFRPLSRADVTSIVDIEFKGIQSRLQERGITIELAPEAREFLLEKGYDPKCGARPLRRAIEQYIEDPISEKILKGAFGDINKIDIVRVNDGLDFIPAAVAVGEGAKGT
ncbi:MAG: ATP-dependent Clp protease ATP-binding subunit [Planctomycetota bacterium]